MNNDTTPLQERIARALYENAEYYGPEPTQPHWDSRDGEERGEWMKIAAAVLPILARLEAQTDIRGRAVIMYRERARKAEAGRDEWRQTALDERGAALDALEQIKVRDARIEAVEDVLSYADMGETLVTRSRIRRALDGDA